MTTQAQAPQILSDPPVDLAWLSQIANAMFQSRPQLPFAATTPPQGVQAPVNIAPPASPLAGPSGLSLNLPGTNVPQGLVPGANLLPSSPLPALSLVHRLPALQPHAQAPNGQADTVLTQLPAYEPRVGAQVLGVATPSAPPSAPVSAAYYFLEPAQETFPQQAATRLDDGLLRAPFEFVSLPPKLEKEPSALGAGGRRAFDVASIRRDFPILQERIGGKPLIWLDNAATTHKPKAVIERLSYFYEHENSNIHRAAHTLAARATDAYEGARERVKNFIHAPDVNEVIFVRGATEAINLVAKSWGAKHIGAGDDIIVSHLEHHANIVPWQQLAAEKGANLRVIPVDDHGQVQLDALQKLLSERTKIVAVTQVSNALGTVVPVKAIATMARSYGAKVLIDAAQSVAHLRVDVQDLGADFLVFSGHKIFGPTGIGVLWGRREVLETMPPWQGGGNMIADVTFEHTTFQPIPNTFEAGTGNIADAVGLGAALDYISELGLDAIARYEHELLCYGTQLLSEIPGLRLIGTASDKASVMSFVLAGYTTEDVGRALNQEGIAVRTGHHCAQPILRRFGVETTVRPSLAFYNTFEELDVLARVVHRLARQR